MEIDALEHCPAMGVSKSSANLKPNDSKGSPLGDVDDLVQPAGRSEESTDEKKIGPLR